LDALNTSKQYENQDHIVEESSESKLNGQMSFEMPIDEWEPKYCLCNRVSFETWLRVTIQSAELSGSISSALG